MKKLLALIFLTSSIFLLEAQITSTQRTFDIQAEIKESPASIKLKWELTSFNTKITIKRKLKEDISWGTGTILADNAVEYTDNSVTVGKVYEYYLSSSQGAVEYISVCIKLPLVDYRGKLILLVESTTAPALADEITRLMMDIRGDGWQVTKIEADKSLTPPQVKALIKAEYDKDPIHTKAVFLFGKIAQPLAGCIMPDGHGDHLGAWSTDTYYADIDGAWTDATASCTTNPSIQNIPGDGKFDQSTIPSDVELQVGRVDFSKLPAFTETETELLRRYLNKDHNFRIKKNSVARQAYILDYFTQYDFAVSGFYYFKSIFGKANTSHVSSSHIKYGNGLWMSSTSAGRRDGFELAPWGTSDLFLTANCAVETYNYIFTMVFGSYFGDYQFNNAFMHALLASKGSILTTSWAGWPKWFYHHMANGENIGYSAKLNMNNTSSQYSSSYSKAIQINLLGDPSLRQDMIRTPMNVSASVENSHVKLSWSPSKDSIEGYHIYKAKGIDSVFIRVTSSGISDTTWTDPDIATAQYYYQVKAFKLEQTRSGSYYNTSRGITVSNDPAVTENQNSYIVYKPQLVNPNPDQIGYIKKSFLYTVPANTFTHQDPDAIMSVTAYKADSTALPKGWTYNSKTGAITVAPQPAKPLSFDIVLKAIDTDKNFITDTFKITILDTTTVIPPIRSENEKLNFTVYPNPASEYLTIECLDQQTLIVDILNREGKLMESHHLNPNQVIDIRKLPSGIYFLKVISQNEILYGKFIKQ